MIPSTTIHVTGKLITPQLDRIITDRSRLFKMLKMKDAPFAEVIGYMSGFELVKNDLDCGGYCDREERVIAINEVKEWHPLQIRKTSTGLPINRSMWLKSTLMHEIAHALQAEVEIFEKQARLLSWKVNMEWQAESIAYKLCNACFGPIHHKYFGAYFNTKDILFLKQWHGNYIENDLMNKDADGR